MADAASQPCWGSVLSRGERLWTLILADRLRSNAPFVQQARKGRGRGEVESVPVQGAARRMREGPLGTRQPVPVLAPLQGGRVVMGAGQCVECVSWQWQPGFTSGCEVKRQGWLWGWTDQHWASLPASHAVCLALLCCDVAPDSLPKLRKVKGTSLGQGTG